MKQILLIQFRKKPVAVAGELEDFQRRIQDRAQVRAASIFDTDQPWHAPAQVLTGADGMLTEC